jgi:hypothetical protein
LDVNGTLKVRSDIFLGFTSVDNAHLCTGPSGNVHVCSSSLRYKTKVSPYAGGLSLLSRLRPISFDWKSSGGHDIGLAAEEVAEVEPRFTLKNAKGEVEGVKYDQLSAVFINAFKEQQQMIERQALQNEEQRLLIERQGRQLEQLQARLARVERTRRKKRTAGGR